MEPIENAPSENEEVRETLPMVRDVTRQRAKDLRKLFSKYIKRHLPEPATPKTAIPEPPRMVGSYAKLLPLLSFIPWFLIGLFVFSAFWDFPGYSLSIFGREYLLEGLIRILSVSGLIGFLTNWLAITMLFNPRERRPLFGQGLIPAQRDRVIFRMASTISEELINAEIIKQKIEESGIIQKYREIALSVTKSVVEDEEFRTELKSMIASYTEQVIGSEEVRNKIIELIIQKIEEYAGQGIGGLALKTYRLINEEDFQRRIEGAVTELPEALDTFLDEFDHLLDIVPEKIEARSEDIEKAASRMVISFVENLDLYAMITTNMQRYDDKKLEELLKRATNEQLNYIKYLGGILGCIGGFVIWQPATALIVLGLVGGVLYGVDVILYQRSNR